ncbi:uncharacterized protein LOC128199485 [Bicyclus anynana]|uniref:Uncharacterized protein LOC128199485 n=1 Tax=Bicyclus anynana TaxID=110368 RepID=A0ABM3M2N9_BICAN|nr:uncharacterized protein LOC128199485 [Bicyclus anynana]
MLITIACRTVPGRASCPRWSTGGCKRAGPRSSGSSACSGTSWSATGTPRARTASGTRPCRSASVSYYCYCRMSYRPRPCLMPTLEHGRVQARRSTLIRFKCLQRYELVGNRYATCKDGQWDAPVPVCVRELLLLLPHVVPSQAVPHAHAGARAGASAPVHAHPVQVPAAVRAGRQPVRHVQGRPVGRARAGLRP